MPRGVKAIKEQLPRKEMNYAFILQTPFPQEFRTWLWKELDNFVEWNPKISKKIGTNLGFEATFLNGDWWEIRTSMDKKVRVMCSHRFVWIRAGLRINAKQGRLEVS